jgi:hypothetical protein
MTVAKLIQLVLPPCSPMCFRSLDERSEIESRFGLTFPEDYWELSRAFGAGTFRCGSQWLGIVNPCRRFYVESIEYENSMHRKHRDFYHDIPQAFFPEPNGLFHLGSYACVDTDVSVGGSIWWRIEGIPDAWPIMTNHTHGPWRRYDVSLGKFLVDVFTNELQLDGFPIESNVTFEPDVKT